MKKHLLSGLAILIPILIVFITLKICLNLITAPFYNIVHDAIAYFEKSHHLEPSQHAFLTMAISKIAALLVLLILSTIIGYLAHKYFFKYILKKIDKVFSKIPLIKTIFHISQDLSSQFFNENPQMFQKTVITPFPGKDTVTIGFITSEVKGKFKEAAKDMELCVFIPTAPHPVSGFVLLTTKKDVQEIDVSIDDAFRFIISCGVSKLD